MYRQLRAVDYTASVDPPYPGTLLKEGVQSSEVARMQTYLNAIAAKYYPQMTKLSVDGIFGPKTKRAVSEFQALTAQKVDGIIGSQTWDKIVVDYNSIAGGGEYVWPGITLRPGSQSSDIKYMQANLNTIGKIYTAIAQQPADGMYGNNTTNAVRLFQKQFGLTADGLIGHMTWDRIYQVCLSVLNMQYPPVSSQYPGNPVRLGSSGDSVRFIQSYLDRIRTVSGAGWPMLNVDGIYGDSTYNAVAAFQSRYNLRADGIVGYDTWIALVNRFNSSL